MSFEEGWIGGGVLIFILAGICAFIDIIEANTSTDVGVYIVLSIILFCLYMLYRDIKND